MSVRVEHGDCIEVMRRLIKEGVVVDSIVTDPPYHLTSIVKRFGETSRDDDTKTSERSRQRSDGYARLATGFMGKKWDGGDIAFRPEVWKLALQILKPGGHMLVFGGTRTYHRMACAVEDAGFEIRDAIMWHYGSGFPKSHNVSKGIDRAAGVEREVIDQKVRGDVEKAKTSGVTMAAAHANRNNKDIFGYGIEDITAPATDAAREWDGWGTALKPATEILCLARKPLSEKTIAANVLEHSVGALNIDGCRVGTEKREYKGGMGRFNDAVLKHGARPYVKGVPSHSDEVFTATGRWPANIVHDGSPEVMEEFARFGDAGGGFGKRGGNRQSNYGFGEGGTVGFGDTGTAARFFYTAKADKGDRLGSKHPTVKPVDLIAYLCRLITPPKGLILDPFAGSGTTAMACIREGFDCILIEREAEYIADIEARLAHIEGADTPLFEAPT